MPALKRVAPVLPVRDVRRALEHYRRLGFETEPYEEAGPDGPVYGFIGSGDVDLHLAAVPDLDAGANTSACYIYVENADALYAEWNGAGVDGRFAPPKDTPYGLREFVHWDPDGNLLRVGSPLEPRAT
jgi:hypothetical protein